VTGDRVGLAIVGAGAISDEYLENLTRFPDVSVHVVADALPDRARSQAKKHGVPGWGTIDDALAHPDVEIVANLTIPAAHAEVSAAILRAGRHVWTEKPLAVDLASGAELLELATRRGLRLGCAPDTILGPGLQAAQRAIASGLIGEPLSAITLMQDPGPESWHPNPEFLYAKGGGPLWDRGPYYLAMLTLLLGPLRSVTAVARSASAQRTIGDGSRAGTAFPVEVPTHVGVMTEFATGALAQSVYSFDSALPRNGFVEISGTEGTLAVPDPNQFTGDLLLFPARRWTVDDLIAIGGVEPARSEWTVLPTPPSTAKRGTGILDMASSIRAGVAHRASGELGYHVLDALTAIDHAATSRSCVEVQSTVESPEALPDGWDPYDTAL